MTATSPSLAVCLCALAALVHHATLVRAVTRTFTTCGVIGPTGPSQLDCDTSYGQNGLVAVTEGLQSYTIPYAGDWKIVAAGARGGQLALPNNAEGHGAIVEGVVSLQQGDVVTVLVGQIPVDRPGGTCPGDTGTPGGGASFVVLQTATGSYTMTGGGLSTVKVSPLVVAGGGGGIRHHNCANAGGHGRGLEGNPTVVAFADLPGSGAGFAANGDGGCTTAGASPAQSFLNGGQGHGTCTSYAASGGGGFGGGGTPWDGGGGGGGWQGGGATNGATGAGGSSYIDASATDVVITSQYVSAGATANEGPGFVTLELAGCSPDGDWPAGVPAGTTAVIPCASGYINNRTRLCFAGDVTLEWAAPDESACAPRPCPALSAPPSGLYNGVAVLSDGVFGTVATLTCGEGPSDVTSVLGSTTSQTCSAGGSWVVNGDSTPACTPTQMIGVHIQHDNGALIFGSTGSSSALFQNDATRELAVSGNFKVHGKVAIADDIEDLAATVRDLKARLAALEQA